MALPGVFAYPANNFPFSLLGYRQTLPKVVESRKEGIVSPSFTSQLRLYWSRTCAAACRAQF